MNVSAKLLLLSVGVCLLVAPPPVSAQTSLFHDPFLNWDFINRAGGPANDFEIVVGAPAWMPPEVYTGFFPNFETRVDPESGGTILSWSGTSVQPGEIAHVGAAMMGSGRILDAYWTNDGVKVGQSIAITYETTQVFRLPNGPDAIAMNLQTAPAFEGTAGLLNIRTWSDLPEDLLGLGDLTSALDPQLSDPPFVDLETIPVELVSLQLVSGDPFIETLSLEPISPLPGGSSPPDSFFDVFVGLSTNTNPDFESLLTAEVVEFNPGTQQWDVIGRFWNINPQSPEPSTLVLLALGGAAVLVGRR